MKSPKPLKAITMAIIMAGLAAVIVENAAAADIQAVADQPRAALIATPASPAIPLPLRASDV